MMAIGIPANAKQLAALVKEGEGPTLEFKRSTGELKEGMQTLCAFLNGSGGMVLFGVRPDGAVEGQEVSDQTLRDVAQAADRFEPPAHVSIHRIKLTANREVLALSTDAARDVRPFTYEGRAYERVESTTRRMPQAKYERLLLDRTPEVRGDHRCGRGDLQGECPWATADHRPSCRATWDGCRPKSVPSPSRVT